jgi:hypothetical protein
MSNSVASRELIAVSKDGERFNVVLRIGAPQPGPRDSWICTTSTEGLPHRPVETHGADSLQALLLAIQTMRGQLEHFVKGGGKLYLPGDEGSGPMLVSEVFSD